MKLRLTKDGSHTLYNGALDETYHSSHGAIQEAKHVFIKYGINGINQKQISVLEIGFGTGLNAILTHQFAKDNELQVNYTGLESFPLKSDITEKLNYLKELPTLDKLIFESLHSSEWNEAIELDSNFRLNKIEITLQKFVTEEKFDLIYYDAFGPRAQKEMWEKPLFEKLFKFLKSNGKLVTYCAMGQFKRDLKACGFIVESVPGPPGKREMTIAYKND